MSIYQIDGFAYTSRERAKQAKKEKDGIRYIREKTDLSDPDVVLRLYNKLLDEKLFETEVGISFLQELRQELILTPYIMNDEIRPIPAKEDVREEHEREEERERQRIKERAERTRREEVLQNEANRNYKKKFQIATFFCVVLAAAIVGIFVITFVSGKSATILNYEEEVINKYESWEAELNERERALTERENLLQQKIDQMQVQE